MQGLLWARSGAAAHSFTLANPGNSLRNSPRSVAAELMMIAFIITLGEMM